MKVEIKIPEKEFKEILDSMIILVDSREKENKHILDYLDSNRTPYKVQKLEQGDYSVALPENKYVSHEMQFCNHVVVERKNSLEELSGNFSERTRFENELAELYDKKIKTYLLVENSKIDDIILGNYSTEYNKNAFSASFVSFMDRYNFTPIFTPKELSGKLIVMLLKYHLRNILK